jgi:hypothetical protein
VPRTPEVPPGDAVGVQRGTEETVVEILHPLYGRQFDGMIRGMSSPSTVPSLDSFEV